MSDTSTQQESNQKEKHKMLQSHNKALNDKININQNLQNSGNQQQYSPLNRIGDNNLQQINEEQMEQLEKIQLRNQIYDSVKEQEVKGYEDQLRSLNHNIQEFNSINQIDNQKDLMEQIRFQTAKILKPKQVNFEVPDDYKNEKERFQVINKDYVVNMITEMEQDKQKFYEWDQVLTSDFVNVWFSKRGSPINQQHPLVKCQMMLFNNTNQDDLSIMKLIRDALHNPVTRLKWDDGLDELRVVDDSLMPNLICVYQRTKPQGGKNQPPCKDFLEKKFMFETQKLLDCQPQKENNLTVQSNQSHKKTLQTVLHVYVSELPAENTKFFVKQKENTIRGQTIICINTIEAVEKGKIRLTLYNQVDPKMPIPMPDIHLIRKGMSFSFKQLQKNIQEFINKEQQ
eukprot:403352020